MSVGTKGATDAAGPAGVYYSLSDDLRHWSERKLIIKTETNATFDAAYAARGGPQVPVDLCDLDDPVSHPVIIDPSDPAGSADPALNPNGWRNFDHPGRDPYLYLRIANYHSNQGAANPCGYGDSDRDLIRLPITFNGAHDLSLSKSSSPDPVLVGQPLTYTLSVENNGPANASGVTLTDELPAETSFNSATPSQGNCTETSGTVDLRPRSRDNRWFRDRADRRHTSERRDDHEHRQRPGADRRRQLERQRDRPDDGHLPRRPYGYARPRRLARADAPGPRVSPSAPTETASHGPPLAVVSCCPANAGFESPDGGKPGRKRQGRQLHWPRRVSRSSASPRSTTRTGIRPTSKRRSA